MSKAGLIGRNIIFIGTSRFCALFVTLFLFPYIVSHVGKEAYGIYLIVTAVTGYFGLMDLGVMTALSKFTAEHNGRNDRNRMRQIASASLTFYVAIGIIAGFCIIFFSPQIIRLFRIPSADILLAKKLFIAAGVFALFTWPLQVYRCIIQGFNLWDIDSRVNIVQQIINAAGTIFIIGAGKGIFELFVFQQSVAIASGLVYSRFVRSGLGLKLIFPFLDPAVYRTIFSFSTFLFLNSAISLFIFQAHNIIIGIFLSVSAVTLYAVAYNLQNYFRIINSTLGASPWITAVQMEGSGDYEGQRKLVFKGTKYSSAVFLPLILIMFVFAEPFIYFWMGPGFEASVLPARIIILVWLFNGTFDLASGILSAKGIVRRPMAIQAAVAFANVLIGLCLINVAGIAAPAIGFTLSMVLIGFPLVLRLALNALKIKPSEYFDKCVKPNLHLYLFCVAASVSLIAMIQPMNIWQVLLEMALVYGISLAFYFLLILKKDEQTEVRSVLNFTN